MNNPLISFSSTILLFASKLLVYVINTFSACNLFTKILCLGRIANPYFFCTGSVGSGTALPEESNPTRLSYSFLINNSLSILSL